MLTGRKDMMLNTAISWLYRQCVGDPPQGPSFCYLCGASCPETYTAASGLADTFNSHYLAHVPSSPFLCAACQWYFTSQVLHPEFRKMSLVVSPTSWRNWQRERMKGDIVSWLTRGLEDPAYLVISLSKKKHILLQAPLNGAGSRTLSLQIEEQVAYVSLDDWLYIDERFMRLLALGHGKGEILSGELHPSVLRRHGKLGEALQLNAQLASWRSSALIELVSYITIVEKPSNSKKEGKQFGD
jgi:hypothetical protein